MDDDAKNYEIGYRRPPKGTQFAKGVSGNPNGRPKGSRNLSLILSEIATRPVSITEGKRSRTVPLKEAVLIQMANGAARGDRHARRDFFQLTALSETREEAEGASRIPHERDRAAFDGVLKRLFKAGAKAFPKAVGSTTGAQSTGNPTTNLPNEEEE